MEIGAILKELGTWGGAALIGSMGFTEIVKRAARKANAKVPWYTWLAMPSVIAMIFVAGMVRGGKLEQNMAILVWATITFAGPLLYRFAVEPALKKFGLK